MKRQTEHHFPPDLSGHIAVLDPAEIDHGLSEQIVAVRFERSDMIRVLVGDQDMADGRWIDIQPVHFFFQPVIVVSGIDHDRCSVLGVKENIGYPLTYTRHMIVYVSGIQRFEYLFSAISP